MIIIYLSFLNENVLFWCNGERRSKMANIADVAHEAGVSLATVSRVISRQASVRPETRERVLQAIRKLNYQPNALARQLRTQETKTVVAIVPNIQNSLTHEV